MLREAIKVFQAKTNRGNPAWSVIMSVEIDDSTWHYDSSEEFFADYRKAHGADRGSIEAVFEIFERHAASSRLPVPKQKPQDPLTIFIGHGSSPQWRDLKDHLYEKHAYRVQAYEIGARAGHAIRDVLIDMLSKSIKLETAFRYR